MSANWVWEKESFENLCVPKSKIFSIFLSIAVIGKEAYVIKIFLLKKLDVCLTL